MKQMLQLLRFWVDWHPFYKCGSGSFLGGGGAFWAGGPKFTRDRQGFPYASLPSVKKCDEVWIWVRAPFLESRFLWAFRHLTNSCSKLWGGFSYCRWKWFPSPWLAYLEVFLVSWRGSCMSRSAQALFRLMRTQNTSNFCISLHCGLL